MRQVQPSDRNYAIFCEVEFEHASLRSVAEQFGISPTRVQQIVEQVRTWYQSNTPEWVRTIDPARQPLIAHAVFEQRLAHLSRQAMEAWRKSQGEVTVTRKGPLSSGSTTAPSFGRGSYLAIVARLDRMRMDADARLCKWLEERGVAVEPAAVEGGANPCAREDAEVTQAEVAEPEAVLTTADEEPTYGDEHLFTETISLPLRDAPNPVRSRKERRRRQRQLQRALGRK